MTQTSARRRLPLPEAVFVRRIVWGWVGLVGGPLAALFLLLFAVGAWGSAIVGLAMAVPFLLPIVPAAGLVVAWARLVVRSADDPHRGVWMLLSVGAGTVATAGSFVVVGFLVLAAVAPVLPVPHHRATEVVGLIGAAPIVVVCGLAAVYGAVAGAFAAINARRLRDGR